MRKQYVRVQLCCLSVEAYSDDLDFAEPSTNLIPHHLSSPSTTVVAEPFLRILFYKDVATCRNMVRDSPPTRILLFFLHFHD
jgi:hypothetical protein